MGRVEGAGTLIEIIGSDDNWPRLMSLTFCVDGIELKINNYFYFILFTLTLGSASALTFQHFDVAFAWGAAFSAIGLAFDQNY